MSPPLQHLSDTSTLIKALKEINRSPELNYLTQIIFMLFEDTSKDLQAEDRFRVDIHFSPGVKFRQEVFVDDSDTISPTNSYTNMPIKSSPDLPKYHTFVKRLPQSGHEFIRQLKPSIEQLMISKSAPHLRKSSLVSKTKTCDDLTVENNQSRRNSTGVLKSNSDPIDRPTMSPIDESLCSAGPPMDTSPILKRPSVPVTVEPTPQFPVQKTGVCILKHHSEVTQKCPEHSDDPSGKTSHGILKSAEYTDTEHQKTISNIKGQFVLTCNRKVSYPEKTPEPEAPEDISDSSETPRELTPVSPDSSRRSSTSDNDRPMIKRTKPFLYDSSDLDLFGGADSSLRSSEVTHNDVSELYRYQAEIHRRLEKRRLSEFSESSHSSDNTISTPVSVGPSSRKTSVSTCTLQNSSSSEGEKQPRRSVPFLGSRSDSNLVLLRKVSFPLYGADHPFQKISDEDSSRRSPSAIHGSMERLEVLEGLEPLRNGSTPNSLVSLDWDGEKGTACVHVCMRMYNYVHVHDLYHCNLH